MITDDLRPVLIFAALGAMCVLVTLARLATARTDAAWLAIRRQAVMVIVLGGCVFVTLAGSGQP